MKRFCILFTAGISILYLSGCTSKESSEKNSLRLWYLKPASVWEEALPVGNGRLGAMVFGDPLNERIQINEESIWAGSKINNNNPGALKNLPELRKAIFESRFRDAYRIAEKNFLGTPPRIRSYQPFGDLLINYEWQSEPSAYMRELDLESGTVTTSFTAGGRKFRQDVFASSPDNVIVVYISSADGGRISASFALRREKDATVNLPDNSTITLAGQIVDTDDPLSGPGGAHMRFAGELRISQTGGSSVIDGERIKVSGAESILLKFTSSTDYNMQMLGMDRTIDPGKVCSTILDKCGAATIRELKKAHLKEYQPLFSRVGLTIGADSMAGKPTDERLSLVKKGGIDNGLIALYFQYGRYLLMSSSRYPGVLPANLQGIWNKDMKAPWNSDFHTNINLQMNYWPAEVCNLSETTVPLTGFMEKLVEPGTVTAREMYGTDGWVFHHLTDPFGRTGVADGVWGITPMNGPWMTFPLYEHFLFTLDTAYLRDKAYPIMKGSAEFVLGFLTESPEGYLVTNPSHSPENNFIIPGTRESSALTYAATIDIEIINALFENCIVASSILGTDSIFAVKLRETLKRLPPVRINSRGVIQEWIHDYEEREPGHRHMSHLLGLYPLDQFTPSTPELFRAAEATIERRLSFGGGHTGWSRAWIVNFFARLQNGEKAYFNLQELLRKSTLPNLFDTHPPFQIDGNFGATAGIAEMLLQSHEGVIRLLPAIPAGWESGEVKGLCARGGFVVNMKWSDGKIERAEIYSPEGGRAKVVYDSAEKEITLKAGESAVIH